MTSKSCRLGPAIWSRDTGQQILCFGRCQLIMTWISNIKVHCKPRLFSLSTYYWEYGRHVARLRRPPCAYAPTNNAASHDKHEKVNSWVSFSFLYELGLRLATLRAAGAPLLIHKHHINYHISYRVAQRLKKSSGILRFELCRLNGISSRHIFQIQELSFQSSDHSTCQTPDSSHW